MFFSLTVPFIRISHITSVNKVIYRVNQLKLLCLVELPLLSYNFSSKLNNLFKSPVISHGLTPYTFLNMMLGNPLSKCAYRRDLLILSLIRQWKNLLPEERILIKKFEESFKTRHNPTRNPLSGS